MAPEYAVKHCLNAPAAGAEPQKDGVCDHLAVYDAKTDTIEWKNDKERERKTPWVPPQSLIEHTPVNFNTCRDFGCLTR